MLNSKLRKQDSSNILRGESYRRYGGRGRNRGRRREGGRTNLIHLPFSPWLGQLRPSRGQHRICPPKFGELREENRSLLFQSRCKQRRGAATAPPRAAVALCAPPRNFDTLDEKERSIEYKHGNKSDKSYRTGVCFRRENDTSCIFVKKIIYDVPSGSS